VKGTAYLNCEICIFDFTPESTKEEAPIREGDKGKPSGVRPLENDGSILAVIRSVERAWGCKKCKTRTGESYPETYPRHCILDDTP
jgi:hypothetical protein